MSEALLLPKKIIVCAVVFFVASCAENSNADDLFLGSDTNRYTAGSIDLTAVS